ncbi:condensation domain-containing protein [Micromonospora sp. CA-246542]|uniref:condensation domain-containing protein n=1 Tax=Micromonospora sp. CA-246542 TaxID=3239959 RepID=UPI003D93E2D7
MSSDAMTAKLARLTPEQRARLLQRLTPPAPALAPRPGPRDLFPLGMDQERLWVLDQLNPRSNTYNISFGLQFNGRLDVGVLRRAVHDTAARHESLRSTVTIIEEQPMQRVHTEAGIPVTVADLRQLPAELRARRAAEEIRRHVREPFDLTTGPVLRILVVRLSDEVHQVIETMHHSATDQWSYIRLNREILERYRAELEGRSPVLPPLPVQFGDFAAWQRGYFSGERRERHRAFWRKNLAGAPDRLALPYDASPDTTDHEGAHLYFRLDDEVAAAFIEHSRGRRATLATALLAVYVGLLFAHTGERDIVVGLPSVTRAEPASHNLVGFLLTSVPIRVQLPEHPSPDDILAATTKAAMAVAEQREVPFGEIVDAVAPERSANRLPLVQTMHLVLDFNETVFEVPGADVHGVEVEDGVSPMDLTLGWWRADDRLYGRFEYRTALFTRGSIDRLASRLLQLVKVFVAAPNEPLRPEPVSAAVPRTVAAAPAGSRTPEVGSTRAEVSHAWCQVLGVSEVGDTDQFFTSGGTSLLAVKLSRRLRELGLTASVRDIFTAPTFAALVATVGATAAPENVENSAALAPTQEDLLSLGRQTARGWSHTLVLDLGEPVDAGRMREALDRVVRAHPTLTSVFAPDGTVAVGGEWLWDHAPDEPDAAVVAMRQRAAFDLEHGPLFAAALTSRRLAISANHLVVDGFSWQVLIADLAAAYAGADVAAETVPQHAYAAALRAVDFRDEVSFWRDQLTSTGLPDSTGVPDVIGDETEHVVTVPLPPDARPSQAVALAALGRAIPELAAVDIVGLGREPVGQPAAWDELRAVGYYATAYPIALPTAKDLPGYARQVASRLLAVPHGGVGYAALRWSPDPRTRRQLEALPTPAVSFNYQGEIGEPQAVAGSLFNGCTQVSIQVDPATPRHHLVDVIVEITGSEAVFRWRHGQGVRRDTIERFAARAAEVFTDLVEPTADATVPGRTGITRAAIDDMFAELSQNRRSMR